MRLKLKKRHPMVLAAKLVSNLFHPTYYPMLCLCILFYFTFLQSMGMAGIASILGLTALFTIVIPSLLVFIYRKVFRIPLHDLHHRNERFVPYSIYLICYFILLHRLQTLNVHGLILDVVIVSILIQICCTLINCAWKVSIHAAGAGAIVGFLLIHCVLYEYYPLLPVIIAILLCGIVGTSRLILRRHTLAQVNAGTLLGILCGIAGTMLSSFRGFL